MDNASLFIQTDSTLVSLDKHCYHIAQVLNALGTTREYDDEGWHTVCDWFRVASSIKSVDTLLWPMDESGLWCSPAAEYDDEKHKIYNRVTNDLILFNTIYSGLESLITLLKPLGIKKDGKIKAASKYLETFSANFAPLKYQLELTELLRRSITCNDNGVNNKYFKPDEFSDILTFGLRAAYSLRNHSAHGSYMFPEPDGWRLEDCFDTYAWRISSRILLITNQMLLMVHFRNIGLKDTHALFEEPDEMFREHHSLFSSMLPSLKTLHLKPRDRDKNQHWLF